jgi:hypothetical protein
MSVSVGPVSDAVAAWLSSHGVPRTAAEFVAVLFVCAAPVLGIVFPIAGVAQYFERKIAAMAASSVDPIGLWC